MTREAVLLGESPITWFSPTHGTIAVGTTVFDIRATYVSYSFVVVSWLKGTDAVGRVVLRVLIYLSQGNRSFLTLDTSSLYYFSLFFSPSVFAETIIKCVKKGLARVGDSSHQGYTKTLAASLL